MAVHFPNQAGFNPSQPAIEGPAKTEAPRPVQSPPPNHDLAEIVPMGPAGGLSTFSNHTAPEVPRRITNLLTKLDRDPGFGSGVLTGMGSSEASEVVERIGDLFNPKRQRRLHSVVHKALDAMQAGHGDAIQEAVTQQMGVHAAQALLNYKAEPLHCAGVLSGAVATHQTLGKRTRLATVANRLEAITQKVLDAAPAPSKTLRLRDRPLPTKVGAESQGELAGKMLRTDGRISGRRFAGKYRQAQVARAEALGLKVETDADAFLDSVGASAGFDHSTGTIRIRCDASALEWFHELTHAEQWKDLGPEAYMQQSRMERELHVFKAIANHSVDFNAYEYEAARNYIVRLADMARVPHPPEVQ